MKKLIILFIICTSGLLFQTASAQVSLRVNLGLQPNWGPSGYDHVEYYYLPDIDAYYYVPTHRYIYRENGSWINRSYLPGRYRGYNMYNTRKIVINEPRPYMRHNEYRQRYERSNDGYDQRSMRDNSQGRYYQGRNYQQHSEWRGDRGNYGGRQGGDNGRFQGGDNGRHQGRDNGGHQGGDNGRHGGQGNGRGHD